MRGSRRTPVPDRDRAPGRGPGPERVRSREPGRGAPPEEAAPRPGAGPAPPAHVATPATSQVRAERPLSAHAAQRSGAARRAGRHAQRRVPGGPGRRPPRRVVGGQLAPRRPVRQHRRGGARRLVHRRRRTGRRARVRTDRRPGPDGRASPRPAVPHRVRPVSPTGRAPPPDRGLLRRRGPTAGARHLRGHLRRRPRRLPGQRCRRRPPVGLADRALDRHRRARGQWASRTSRAATQVSNRPHGVAR